MSEDCGLILRTADCGLGVKCRLTVKCRLQTKGKMQNGDRRLGVKCIMKTADCRPGGKMREKTAGNTSVLVEVRRNPLKSGQNVCNSFLCSDRKVCLLLEK